eukprot:9146140-Heterocapsa_arctica.AAC.1
MPTQSAKVFASTMRARSASVGSISHVTKALPQAPGVILKAQAQEGPVPLQAPEPPDVAHDR